jgi:hypothetical protein
LKSCEKRSCVRQLHRIALAAFLTASQFLFSSSAAKAAEHAFQWWLPVYTDFPILKTKLRGYIESNPRLNDGLEGLDIYLLRSAIGYKFKKNMEGYVGYAYVNDYLPTRVQENRIYQQFGYGQVLFKRIQVLHRIRTEQRFFNDREGCANRLRYMLRLATPIPNTRWYVVTSDELFINTNSLNDGPNAGIDQNRLYGALGRQVNRKLRLEVGYQLQYTNRSEPIVDKANHQLMTQAFISL